MKLDGLTHDLSGRTIKAVHKMLGNFGATFPISDFQATFSIIGNFFPSSNLLL